MSDWQEIEELGFYPDLVTRALKRALGGATPLASIFQVEAAFDHESMFNHLSALALTSTTVVQLHVDEQPDGTAMIASAIHPIRTIRGVSFMEVVGAPSSAETSTQEITIALNLGAVRRSDIDPMHCDDPMCDAEHGYQMLTVPDDINMRISAAADGVDALQRAEKFVDVLQQLMAAHA